MEYLVTPEASMQANCFIKICGVETCVQCSSLCAAQCPTLCAAYCVELCGGQLCSPVRMDPMLDN